MEHSYDIMHIVAKQVLNDIYIRSNIWVEFYRGSTVYFSVIKSFFYYLQYK